MAIEGESTTGGRAGVSGRGLRTATLRTIAEIAGLGVTTVSKALKNAPDIGQGTKDRVRQIADELGYHPNRAGVRLRTGRTNVISLVLSPHQELIGFGSEMIHGISEVLHGTSYHLVVTPHFLDDDLMSPIRYVVETRSADGVIFTRTEPDDERIRYLQAAGFPFVSHGRSDAAEPHAYYDFDNASFARSAVKRLVGEGFRRIALLSPPERFTFARHMLDGLRAAAAEHGAEVEVLAGVSLDSSPEEIHRAGLALARRSPRPDGLICPGDLSAASLAAAYQEAGLVAGRDFGLVAKRTFPFPGFLFQHTSVIEEDIRLAGRELTKLLLRRISGEPADTLSKLEVVE